MLALEVEHDGGVKRRCSGNECGDDEWHGQRCSVYENHHIQIHFEKYLTRDLRQFTCFKQYFTKSVGPRQLSTEKLKVYFQTDRQTDELIWGGLGNLRFLQVNTL